jgi:hypothetical protein
MIETNLSVDCNFQCNDPMTGIYWGAFDPPTKAHLAVMYAVMHTIPLKKLLVIINNHSYKTYTYPLEVRIQFVREMAQLNNLYIEVLWQDDRNVLDFATCKQRLQEPLCVVAGYDAYKKWVVHLSSEKRALYDAIAVIPRGDDPAILFDEKAFIVPIPSHYRHLSSSTAKKSLFYCVPSLE